MWLWTRTYYHIATFVINASFLLGSTESQPPAARFLLWPFVHTEASRAARMSKIRTISDYCWVAINLTGRTAVLPGKETAGQFTIWPVRVGLGTSQKLQLHSWCSCNTGIVTSRGTIGRAVFGNYQNRSARGWREQTTSSFRTVNISSFTTQQARTVPARQNTSKPARTVPPVKIASQVQNSKQDRTAATKRWKNRKTEENLIAGFAS